MDLRKDLKDKITSSGISVDKLSRLADVHDGTIRNFLKGKSEIGVDNYQKCMSAIDNYILTKMIHNSQ